MVSGNNFLGNKKVAIIQNRIIKGGRLQVISHFIHTLNSLGIVPDLVTQNLKVSRNDIKKFYGQEIQYNIREIFIDLRIPFEFHILLFNALTSLYCKNYDLIINSSNTSFLGFWRPPVISYVHYPRKDRNISNLKSIHYPEGPLKNPYNFKEFFDILSGMFYQLNININPSETIIANSIFTRSVINRNYPNYRNNIHVIYPPVYEQNSTDINTTGKQRNLIVSLGRFTWEKRQLEQIQIAERLPEYEFAIIGFEKEGDQYFKTCRKYLSERHVENVLMFKNIPADEVKNWLRKATYFIHNTRNEPFGITTVEAIINDCLPIVHNSGGQIEIVENSILRFNDKEDAVEKIRRIDSWTDDIKHKNLMNLKLRLYKYSTGDFSAKIKKLVLKELE